MKLKNFAIQTSSTMLGVLGALLLYHYHLTLAHLAADGFTAVPWHTRYFWPIGEAWWTLPILVLVPVAAWYYATRWMLKTWFVFDMTVMAVAVIGSLLACMFSFAAGYIVFGLSLLALFFSVMIGTILAEDPSYKLRQAVS